MPGRDKFLCGRTAKIVGANPRVMGHGSWYGLSTELAMAVSMFERRRPELPGLYDDRLKNIRCKERIRRGAGALRHLRSRPRTGVN